MSLYLLNVPIQKDVIDQDTVPVVNTQTQSAEFDTFGHALSEQSGLPFPGFSKELRHLVDVVLGFLLASDFARF